MATRYKDWAPTLFDPKGLGCEDKQDWFVAPLIESDHDDAPLTISNFRVAIADLDGCGIQFTVEYFGHWTSNFRIILVAPTEGGEKWCDDAEAALLDYPVLDESDYSDAEHEAEWEAYDLWIRSDFQNALRSAFRSYEGEDWQYDWLSDLPTEAVDTLFALACERTGHYPEHQGGGDFSVDLDRLVGAIEVDDLPDPPALPQIDHGCDAHPIPAFACDACIKLSRTVESYHGKTWEDE